MSEMTLGLFGDLRLEKGGRFCTPGWLSAAVAGFGFAVSEGIAQGRYGSPGFCATRP